jgi:L-serine deaminase
MILQAAEIAIEHSLGLTCDPVDGLVQVPCIERNSLGAVKAVTAAQLALAGDGVHSVSLDEAIEAMRSESPSGFDLTRDNLGSAELTENLVDGLTVTARDMHTHYKETSLAGLAVSATLLFSFECIEDELLTRFLTLLPSQTSVRIPLSSPAC